jgi:two-component system, OmpR family, sensor histidine kinase QseC
VKPRWWHSFQGRAVAAVVGTCLLVWVGWTAYTLWDGSRVQSTLNDVDLKSTAEIMITAFPQAALAQGPSANFKLPAGVQGTEFNYQVWSRDHRLLFRTETTPTRPLNPGFTVGFHNELIDGQHWRSYGASDASGAIHAQIGVRLAQRRSYVRLESMQLLAQLGGLLVGLSAVLIGVMLWTARPLRRLRRQIEARAPTDATPLPDHGLPAEVLPLVHAFNDVLARAEAARLAQQRFVADAAHELRTPLAALRAQAQVAQRTQDPQTAREALTRLQGGIDRSTRVAEQLLDLARVDGSGLALPATLVSLPRLGHDLVEGCAGLSRRRDVSLQIALSVEQVRAPESMLHIALRNLLDNAVRYTPAGGHVTLGSHRTANKRLCLFVQDDGPGMTVSERAQAVQPFVRLHEGQETGSGLGLAIVQRVAQLLGAELRLEDAAPGLRASLLMPSGS